MVPFLYLLILIVLAIIIGYYHYKQAIKEEVAYAEKIYNLLEKGISLAQNEPRYQINIELFEGDSLASKVFEPAITVERKRGGLRRYPRNSKYLANRELKDSFARGYFVTKNDIHIPVRNVRAAFIEEI